MSELKKDYFCAVEIKEPTLFNGVMAAQQILVLLVKVRILVEQLIKNT